MNFMQLNDIRIKDSRDEVHTSTEQVPINPEYSTNKIQDHIDCNLDSNYLFIVCVPFLILKFIQRHL